MQLWSRWSLVLDTPNWNSMNVIKDSTLWIIILRHEPLNLDFEKEYDSFLVLFHRETVRCGSIFQDTSSFLTLICEQKIVVKCPIFATFLASSNRDGRQRENYGLVRNWAVRWLWIVVCLLWQYSKGTVIELSTTNSILTCPRKFITIFVHDTIHYLVSQY